MKISGKYNPVNSYTKCTSKEEFRRDIDHLTNQVLAALDAEDAPELGALRMLVERLRAVARALN